MPENPTPSLSSKQMANWNKLIQFAKAKGYAGRPELDHNEQLRNTVFQEYNKANPNEQVSPEIVKQVQNEIQLYKLKALQDMKQGKGVLAGNGSFMPTISQVDGIFGQKTSQWAFPSAYIIDKATGEKEFKGFAPKVDLYKGLSMSK